MTHTNHTHAPDYSPGLTALVSHMVAEHAGVTLIRSRADQPRDRRPVAAKHQAEHPEVWGAQVTRERAANQAATYHPMTDADTKPCIEIAGAQVYAYVEDGYLRVSVDLDTVESWLLRDDSGELLVPIRIAVGAEDVWATSPAGTEIRVPS